MVTSRGAVHRGVGTYAGEQGVVGTVVDPVVRFFERDVHPDTRAPVFLVRENGHPGRGAWGRGGRLGSAPARP